MPASKKPRRKTAITAFSSASRDGLARTIEPPTSPPTAEDNATGFVHGGSAFR